MITVKLLFVASICFLTNLYAEWDPNALYAGASISVLDHKYTQLKTKVMETLKKKCSKEKINLLMDLTLLVQPKLCVEIGVSKGYSILPIAATLKYLKSGKVFAVDAWSKRIATRYLSYDDPNKTRWQKRDMKQIRKTFQKMIKEWSFEKVCKEIHKASEDAIYDIPSEIDFLHLDGDYSEIGSLRDVELYLPKVKSGGYILFSNFYFMVGREQPKVQAFCALCDACEVIASIEKNNTVLFRKN